MGRPTAQVGIDWVNLRRGQALIIWANTGTAQEAAMVQLELRITEDGELKLFCDKELEALPFTEWQPILFY